MSTEGFILAVLIGIAVYVACHHLLIALRGRRRALNLSFAFLALLLALHQWLNLLRLEPLTVATALAQDWWKSLVELGMFAGFAVFVALFTGRGRRSVVPVVLGLCGVLGALHLFREAGFAVAAWQVLPSAEDPILFERGDWYRRFSWAYHVFALSLIVTTFWAVGAAWCLAREGQRQRGYGLLVSMLLVCGVIINSLGNDLGLWQTVHLIDHVFVALVILMSFVLSDEVVLAARLTEELARREAFLRITLDAIGDGVVVCDPGGRVQRMNPRAALLLACDHEAAIGRPVDELVEMRTAADDRRLPIVELVADGSRRLDDLHLTARDGQQRRISAGGTPLFDDQGRRLGDVLVMTDVSERQAYEARLRQAQKLEAIGRLAGGVAHDFNNMLGGVIGFAEMGIESCRGACPGGSQVKRYFETILQTAERAAGLTRQLLAFSRKQAAERSKIDLHRLIDEVAEVLHRSLGHDITLRCELRAPRPTVLGDLSQLHAVMLNLGLNARDALPNGGELVFATRELLIDDMICAILPEPIEPGPYVQISISDNGEGMAPEVIEHIFEPFFTTKEVGRGTGLGLAMAYGTVREHDGVITVHSQPGEGTVFDLLLPLVESTAVISSGSAAALPLRSARILVADDEEAFREVACMVLRELGHRVESVADGSAAIERINDAPPLDLVILDMIMPGANGSQVHAALRQRSANLPVILSSGFATTEAMRSLLDDPYTQLVQKPYRRRDLLRAVARALGQGE